MTTEKKPSLRGIKDVKSRQMKHRLAAEVYNKIAAYIGDLDVTDDALTLKEFGFYLLGAILKGCWVDMEEGSDLHGLMLELFPKKGTLPHPVWKSIKLEQTWP